MCNMFADIFCRRRLSNGYYKAFGNIANFVVNPRSRFAGNFNFDSK